jgi:hypothetical protein
MAKSTQVSPLVPHALVVGDRLQPYQLPIIERVEILYATAAQVRLADGRNKAQRLVYCIPNEAAWAEIQLYHAKFQTTLDSLANYLQKLGHYPDRLKVLGAEAKNPLTPFVISAPNPDYNHSAGWETWEVYPRKSLRDQVEKHTPQMLKLSGNRLQEYGTQNDHFCCSNDAAYYKFCKLHGLCLAAQTDFRCVLFRLGTYLEATDGRYKLADVSEGASLPLPSKTEVQPDGFHLPPVANGSYVPCEVRNLKPGDRIKQKGDPFFYFFRTYNPKTGIVVASFKQPNHASKFVDLDGHSILIFDKKSLKQKEFEIGDRVTFQQHWYGEQHLFEGTIQSLNDPAEIALVDYDIPAHLQDGIKRSPQLQAPIGTFDKAKVPMGETLDRLNDWGRCAEDNGVVFSVPPECSLTAERDRLLNSKLPPEGAWLETCMASAGFRQAYWRSRTSCLEGKKRRYLGKVNSPAHQAACEAVANRKRLVEVEKQLRLLEKDSLNG